MDSYLPPYEDYQIKNKEPKNEKTCTDKLSKESESKTSKLFKWLGSLTGVITLYFGILPITFEMYGHLKNIEQQRIENTFKFHEIQFKEANLKKALEETKSFQAKLNKDYPIIDKKAREEIQKTLTGEKEDEFFQKYLIIENFYIGLINCIDSKNCHENTVEALFERDIKEFVSTFSPLICKKRKDLELPNLGQSLTKFSKNKELCLEK